MRHPRAAPGTRTRPRPPRPRADLSGLPPTLVSWGRCEVLAGEDEEFAARVKDAGIDTAAVVVPGGEHSYLRCRPHSGGRRRHRTDGRVGPGEDEDLTERYGRGSCRIRAPAGSGRWTDADMGCCGAQVRDARDLVPVRQAA
ncbi:alpha/beta hydrolase fold domain-containing protein [Streptomyces sp. NBC_01373]|uniref:alpha/beta hydrolase n=1 Tax=Streptomyces sp. NBC_01373 TaxID=2903843 RepID=UPI00338EA913